MSRTSELTSAHGDGFVVRSWHCLSFHRERPMTKLLRAERLDEFIIEVHAVVKVLYADALVLAMRTRIVHVLKDAGNAVRGNSADSQIFSVTGACVHHRNDGKSAVQFFAERFQLAHD